MSWNVNDEHLASVLASPAEKQYQYFVGRAADWEEVWLAWSDGEGYAVMEGEDDGQQAIAVWPHRRYVEACQAELFAEYEPVSMSVHAFVDDLLPRVEAEGHEVAVLPMADGRSVTVPVERVREDLHAGLEMLDG